MGGTVFCNKEEDWVWDNRCRHCTYGEIPPGWPMTHCTYNKRMAKERTGESFDRVPVNNRRPEDELEALIRKASWQGERMDKAYAKGQTKLGDNLAIELGKTQKQIKKWKGAGE